MRQVYRLQKKQYKLEQDKIRPPEHLIDSTYQKMKQYQLANPGSSPAPEGYAEGVKAVLFPTIMRAAAIVAAVFVIAVAAVGVYYLATLNLGSGEYQAYTEGFYMTEIVERPGEGENNHSEDYDDESQGVFANDTEEPSDDPNSGDDDVEGDGDTDTVNQGNETSNEQPPSTGEGDGRFQLIIRPPQGAEECDD